jgi:3-hydroxybutyryl-CoA dehydratase
MTELTLKDFQKVEIGEKIPEMSFQITKKDINKYANASGDFNPLHIDEEFAKSTHFKGTIAHGLMTLAYVSQVMTQWHWKGWNYGGGMDVKFITPVRPNDIVTVGGTVIEKDEHIRMAKIEIDVRNQNGDTILIGKTKVTFETEEGGSI